MAFPVPAVVYTEYPQDISVLPILYTFYDEDRVFEFKISGYYKHDIVYDGRYFISQYCVP